MTVINSPEYQPECISRSIRRRAVWLGVTLLLAAPVVAAQDKPLFPEAHDPVLGDRAAVVEWAWSPQYAQRFGLPVQKDGLKEGPLWLLGVKVLRNQYRDSQHYECRIVGLIDNRVKMITPPGDRFLQHPSEAWIGGLPSNGLYVFALSEQNAFVPGQDAWYKRPSNRAERDGGAGGISTRYRLFHRYYLPNLAYFELDGGCWYFRDPAHFRNELRFPTTHEERAEFQPSALKFDFPDTLMQRIYPYTIKASDWNGCLLHRGGAKIAPVKEEQARLGNVSCKPLFDAKQFKAN